MEKLIAELTRLYLLDGQRYRGADGRSGALTRDALARHLRGEHTIALDPATPDGLTRALVLDFDGAAGGDGELYWTRLCDVANALQEELDLPAPAVSINGGNGYGLWLSLAAPVPVAQAREFLDLLRQAHFPEGKEGATAWPALPPCQNRSTGLWAAFINPGMGAAFADEPGLEMTPPAAAQAAFLEGLDSIAAEQFERALARLRQSHGAPAVAPAPSCAPSPLPAPAASAAPDGLLLRDATLEDIIRFLHAKNIEPTFRHLLSRQEC